MLCLCLVRVAQGQEVAAVLSSELKPYSEAYAGFVESLGDVAGVALTSQPEEISPDTRVVVTFGSKAAMAGYPDDATRIHCVAPGAFYEDDSHRYVHVHMLPPARDVLTSLIEIQPELRRLAVLWVLRVPALFFDELETAASAMGVEIVGGKLESIDALPGRLRALMNRDVDALWLPPDPLLITPQSFSVVKQFSHSNDVPFYAPTAGFVKEGAVASISPSFRQIGAAAAQVVRDVLKGESVPREVYPHDTELTINLRAARNSGLEVSPAVIEKADSVLGEEE